MSSRPRQIALLLTAILIGIGVAQREPTAFLLAAVVAVAGLLADSVAHSPSPAGLGLVGEPRPSPFHFS